MTTARSLSKRKKAACELKANALPATETPRHVGISGRNILESIILAFKSPKKYEGEKERMEYTAALLTTSAAGIELAADGGMVLASLPQKVGIRKHIEVLQRPKIRPNKPHNALQAVN